MSGGIPLHDKAYIVLAAFAVVTAALTIVVKWDAWRDRVLMGRHEQPSVIRQRAARIRHLISRAFRDRVKEILDDLRDDHEKPIGRVSYACLECGRESPFHSAACSRCPVLTDDNGEPIGDLLPDVSRPQANYDTRKMASPGRTTGPGHLHDGDLVTLGEDARIEAQWQDDHDELAEDSPGPAPDEHPGSGPTGPGVIIQAAIVQGQTVILDGQPSPPLDDTAYDQVQGPRAGRAAWHGPVRRPPLPAWVQDALRAPTVDDALRDIWVMSQVRALAAP